MIPKIIHQTARTKHLSWEERRLAARLRTMLPGWRYRLWDDADNLALMRDQFPEYAAAYDAIPFGVAKADVARYAYLHAEGGFYFDTDYKLLRPVDRAVSELRCVIPLEFARGVPRPPENLVDYAYLGNSVMGSAAGFGFWRELLRYIFEEKRPERLKDGAEVVYVTGPGALSRFYHENRARFPDIALPDKNLFHPDIRHLAIVTSADARTYGVHLNWGSWRGKPIATAARNLLRRKLNAI